NCNPDLIDYPVPANDDAIRAIRLVAGKLADAIVEGRQQHEAATAEAAEEEEQAELVGTDEEVGEGAVGGIFEPDDEPDSRSAEVTARRERRRALLPPRCVRTRRTTWKSPPSK